MGLQETERGSGTARRRMPSNVLWGVLLLLGGLLLMLDYLDVLPGAWAVWAVAFGVAGAAFLYVFLTQREQWWAAIPAGWLFGLTGVMVWEQIAGAGDDRGGALLLGLGGLGFWAVYARSHESWWAVIPGGALVTLSVMGMVDGSAGDNTMGSMLFFGLAVTFALLTVLPGARMRWPGIVAAGLAVIGILTALGADDAITMANFVVLMGVGGYLIWRAIGPRRPHQPGV
ncbi:hypothetical protein ATJ97_1864 [Georgenia soli]|uniref:DUF5668 domain-containing protein n=2 Tax=Georgenia soli TaxID=638953 RepID=A0A2A9ELG9_9MICO|nr:hypothetical protein ATJ97_1864 [Georgenia soli]